MAIDKPYANIPGTTIFDAEQARKGYHLNQFCMSLMTHDTTVNHHTLVVAFAFYNIEKTRLAKFVEDVLDRGFRKMISLGGNIYFLAKLFFTDRHSFEYAASTMTGMSPEEYRDMMLSGGRKPGGLGRDRG